MSVKQTLTRELDDAISAGIAGLWLQSYEHEDAMEEIGKLCGANQWPLTRWDMQLGLTVYDPNTGQWLAPPRGTTQTQTSAVFGPLEAIKYLQTLNGTAETPQEGRTPAVLVMQNAHLLLQTLLADKSQLFLQMLQNQLWEGQRKSQHIVVLTHTHQMPAELEKGFTLLQHRLPDREQLRKIIRETGEPEWDALEEDAQERLLDAAAGMTRLEVTNAVSISIVRHNSIDRDAVFEFKAAMLKKGNRAAALYEGAETFNDIGGMAELKKFSLELLGTREPNPDFRARGILCCGVSGAGKSMFAKALGKETGRPTIICDLGATFGGRLGQSQAQLQELLDKLDALEPCVALLDELEKTLVSDSSGRTDGGAKSEMKQRLLCWLNDHTSDVFVIGTMNDVTGVLDTNPEILRAGRFDGWFFLDFPTREAKDQIWAIYLVKYEHLKPGMRLNDIELPNDLNWTGAEIENCCRLARIRKMTVAELGGMMPKLADQAEGKIAETRKWATGNCWDAEKPGLYDADAHKVLSSVVSGGPRRNVKRPPKMGYG